MMLYCLGWAEAGWPRMPGLFMNRCERVVMRRLSPVCRVPVGSFAPAISVEVLRHGFKRILRNNSRIGANRRLPGKIADFGLLKYAT
jgi:hypothetical protein